MIMKQYVSFALLLLYYAAVVDADWSTEITSVSGQSFDYSAGAESGSDLKVEVYDLCRRDSGSRTSLGEFYPSSTVTGISASESSGTVSFSFTEGIDGNSDIYTDNGDDTATVEFCAQVGLYYSSTLINFAEVKLTYNVDLVTNFASLAGYTVTEAAAYTDAADINLDFDGTLQAYFCDPNTYDELTDNGYISHQGSELSLCFKVPNGNFEIAEIKDLMVKNGIAAEPSQTLITNTYVDTPTYAEKTCHDSSNADTNVCVVSFLLKADFYDFHQLTLTGTGNILLEFGGATGARRLVRHRLLTNSQERVGHVTVKAMEMQFDPLPEETKEGVASASIPVAVAAVVAIAVLILMVTMRRKCGRKRGRAIKKEQIYQKIQMQKKEQMNCSRPYLTSDTIDFTMSFSTISSSQIPERDSSRSSHVERDSTSANRMLHRDEAEIADCEDLTESMSNMSPRIEELTGSATSTTEEEAHSLEPGGSTSDTDTDASLHVFEDTKAMEGQHHSAHTVTSDMSHQIPRASVMTSDSGPIVRIKYDGEMVSVAEQTAARLPDLRWV